jgi:hypothetical protein
MKKQRYKHKVTNAIIERDANINKKTVDKRINRMKVTEWCNNKRKTKFWAKEIRTDKQMRMQ